MKPKYRITYTLDGKRRTRVIQIPNKKTATVQDAEKKLANSGASDIAISQVADSEPLDPKAVDYDEKLHGKREVKPDQVAAPAPSAAETEGVLRERGPKQVAGPAFVRGLSLDWADELGQALGDTTPQQAEADRLQAEIDRQQNPVTAYGSEILGSIVPYAGGAAGGAWAGAAGGAKLGARFGPYGALVGGVLGAGLTGAVQSVGQSEEDPTLGGVLTDAGIAGAAQLIGGIPLKKGAAIVKQLLGVSKTTEKAAAQGAMEAVKSATKQQVLAESEEAGAKAAALAAQANKKVADVGAELASVGKESSSIAPGSPGRKAMDAAALAAQEEQKAAAAKARALEARSASEKAAEIARPAEVQAAREGMFATGIPPAAAGNLPAADDSEED